MKFRQYRNIVSKGKAEIKISIVVGSRHRRKANSSKVVNLKVKNLKSARRLLCLRRGSIHRALIVNVKSWFYKEVNVIENLVINQKFFYCNINKNIFNYNDNVEIFIMKTQEKIDINEQQKIELMKYLKEKDIDIKYFENFKGCSFLIIFEGYEENFYSYKKGMMIKFINVNYTNNINLFINCNDEEDINILLILFKFYLMNFYEENFSINIFDINLDDDLIFKGYRYQYNILKREEFIEHFEKYLKILHYFDNLIIDEKQNKNYLYLETKENLNIKEVDKFFLSQENKKEYFLNFKGHIFLIEIDIVKNNIKLKRYIIVFSNINYNYFVYFLLLDDLKVDYICYILEHILICKNDDISNDLLLDTYKDILLNHDYSNLLTLDDKFKMFTISKENTQMLILNNLELVIFFLKYYHLFL